MQRKYNKEQINPFKNDWEKTGVAILLEEEAEVLNNDSNVTKTRYVLDKPKKTTVKK